MATTSSSCGLSAALAVATVFMAGSPALRAAEAGPAGVRQFYRINDTGLTRCTRDFMTLTTECAGTGQDIETGRDSTKPAAGDGHAGFSFVKVCNSGELAGAGSCLPDAVLGPGSNDWGCLHDRVTGLDWELKTNDGSQRDQNRHFPYVGDDSPGDASRYVNDTNVSGLCGHSDWRLPTTYELYGLVNFNRSGAGAAVDIHWIPNTPAEWYWAAEAYFPDPGKQAWAILFQIDFYNEDMFRRQRTNRSLVRLVRMDAAQPAPAPRVVPDASGDDVTDHAVHVVWRRCVEGMTWNGTTCKGQPGAYSFSEAIARAHDEAARTGLPWRLPNIKELHMIVDKTTFGPVIDLETFPGTPTNRHWSSTASTYDPSLIWTVDFLGGQVASIGNGFSFYLRLVRDQ
jgi:hypothetical protein